MSLSLSLPASSGIQTRCKVFSPGKHFGQARWLTHITRAVTKFPGGYVRVGGGRRYLSGVIFRETSSHESTLALRDCSPYRFTRVRHPCALPYPTRAVSPFPLPLSIVIMETIILLSPWLLFSPIALSLPFAPSLSFSLSFTISRTPSTSHGVFSILPLPPLLLLSLCDRSSLSFYLRIHGFQRNVSFYRCTDRKRNVFAARSATMRCADGKGNGRLMVVLVRMMVMVMVVAAAAVAAATASYLFARLRSNHRFV